MGLLLTAHSNYSLDSSYSCSIKSLTKILTKMRSITSLEGGVLEGSLRSKSELKSIKNPKLSLRYRFSLGFLFGCRGATPDPQKLPPKSNELLRMLVRIFIWDYRSLLIANLSLSLHKMQSGFSARNSSQSGQQSFSEPYQPSTCAWSHRSASFPLLHRAHPHL